MNPSQRNRLDRRTVLKGLVGGVLASIALPPLEAMMNANGTAYAGANSFPKRFGMFFWGNGVIPDRWTPTGSGTDWQLSEELQPLAALKSEITVVSGMRVATLNSEPHGSGPAGLLTGDQLRNGTVAGPTVDQVIANAIGGDTRFRSLEIGVQRDATGFSYSGPNQVNPPETSPRALFARLFGEGFRLPGESTAPDPNLALRRSVLDAVTAQSARLGARLGASDRARLEQHLDGIRGIESQLTRLAADPPNLAACMRPGMPMAEYPDVMGRPQVSAVSRVMADILAMALACDQTRVFTNMFSQPVNNVLYGNASAGHHELTHNEAGAQPEVNGILLIIMQELAYFLDALKRVPEGDGTVLDHSIVLCTTDVSFGRTHAIDNYPIVLAGSANGALRKGLHYHSASAENASTLMLSLVRAMGLSAAEYGIGPGHVTSGLSAIEV